MIWPDQITKTKPAHGAKESQMIFSIGCLVFMLFFVVWVVWSLWRVSTHHKRWLLLFSLDDLPIEDTLDAMGKIRILKIVDGKLQIDITRGLKKFDLDDFAKTVGNILHHDNSLYLPVATQLAQPNGKLSQKDLKIFLDKAGYRHKEVRNELEKALVALEAYDPQEGEREEKEAKRKEKEKDIRKGLKTFLTR